MGQRHSRSRAILYEGFRPPANGAIHRIGDRHASLGGRNALRFWRRQLRIRVREAPNQSFKNPSPAELRRAIDAESRHYHFRVLSIRFLRPRQLAPEVIVETSDYLRLAQAVPRIIARIDPRSPAADDAKGWAYEGLYFEADDERRVPFLSVSNFLRGPNGAVASSRAASAFIPIRTPDGHSRPGGREAPRRSTRRGGPAELVQELRS